MTTSPFATHRGRLVRRVFVGLGLLSVGLFVLSRAASGPEPVAAEKPKPVFGVQRQPHVEAPIADPFKAARDAAQNGAGQRGLLNGAEQRRYDALILVAGRFAVAYSSYTADTGVERYVAGLPYVADEARAVLLADAQRRWTQITADRTVAVARLGGNPAQVVVFEAAKAQVRVQVIQDVTGTAGQRTYTYTYRIDLAWLLRSASPSPSSAPSSVSPSSSADPVDDGPPLPGEWRVSAVQTD
jgi:hypothetical protein